MINKLEKLSKESGITDHINMKIAERVIAITYKEGVSGRQKEQFVNHIRQELPALNSFEILEEVFQDQGFYRGAA